ncbi:sugar phosphate isomerase/epimerase [Mesorhizobium sp.]|uniref:sugar phosphate isomerase/epimerase family protein n=1 Tax=Mesorhizobium sp. TaxID=1871066 RepID=UPI00257D6BEA|nr:sugar phosphate isomerase/epimerase [Mesorhizobium sp.]
MVVTVNSTMMPFSNVAHLPFEEKLRATRLAGFGELSLMPLEVERLLEGGMSFAEMRSRAADQGVSITRLDPLNTWPRIWRPDNMDEAYIRSVDTTPDAFFRLIDGLGCTHMSLNATFPLNAMSIDEITQHYAAICRRAATYGVTCDLEFIPLWGVPALEMAWQIVSAADQPNSGLVFDVWHFVRSRSKLDTLRQIPSGMIHCLQLNDGPLDLPAGISIKDDCYNRLFPGDGDFPNVEIIRILAEGGGLNQVGPEVFSPMLATMSTEEVGAKSAASIADAFDAAGVNA